MQHQCPFPRVLEAKLFILKLLVDHRAVSGVPGRPARDTTTSGERGEGKDEPNHTMIRNNTRRDKNNANARRQQEATGGTKRYIETVIPAKIFPRDTVESGIRLIDLTERARGQELTPEMHSTNPPTSARHRLRIMGEAVAPVVTAAAREVHVPPHHIDPERGPQPMLFHEGRDPPDLGSAGHARLSIILII